MAEDAGEDQAEPNWAGEPMPTEPPAAASPEDVVNEEPEAVEPPEAENFPSDNAVDAVLALLEEHKESLNRIAADLLAGSLVRTPSELEVAAAETADVTGQLQRRLNTAADAFRQRDNETGRGERDADAAELLKGSWETINEALAELMVLNFDQESLHETIQKLTEIIQTISAASQDTAAKLEETLADLHESGVTR
ncbi:MAG: hypothetical protein CMJ64_06040 [Planctomycetaceae bacterium]|nr:hypothetical protein [Planctomycetaceae bacterium]